MPEYTLQHVIKHKAARPYNNGRTRFNKRGRPGCYVIMKNGRPLYVGFSASDLYKTLYRHFQSWNDPKQVRAVYNPNDEAIRVRVIYTNTPKQAAALERALIVKYEPRDNTQKLINYTPTAYDEAQYTEMQSTPLTPIVQQYEENPF